MDTGVSAIPGTDFCDEGYYESWKCGNLMDSDNHCALLDKKTRNVGYMSALALIGSLIVDNILLKNLVARTRPYEVIDGLKLLIEKQSDYSFPSGHTGSSFASAIVLWKELPGKYGVMALIVAVLIAYSRLYVGVHYPSDVLAGVVIGTVLALVSVWLVKRFRGRRNL